MRSSIFNFQGSIWYDHTVVWGWVHILKRYIVCFYEPTQPGLPFRAD